MYFLKIRRLCGVKIVPNIGIINNLTALVFTIFTIQNKVQLKIGKITSMVEFGAKAWKGGSGHWAV